MISEMDSDLYAIKTPSGRLVNSSCRSVRAEVVEDYIFSEIRHGVMVDRKDWHGPAFFWRYWLCLRRAGFRVVRIRVTMLVDDANGWRIPQLQEVAA